MSWFSQTIHLSVPHKSSSIISANVFLPWTVALGFTHPVAVLSALWGNWGPPHSWHFLLLPFPLSLPPILSKLVDMSTPEGRSAHSNLLPPAPPRNPAQGHWGEPVPDAAAGHHHQHHGQRPPPEHLLSQLQRPCWGQQAARPSRPGCRSRREPLRWWLQLYPAHLSLSKCDQHLGVTVSAGRENLLLLCGSHCYKLPWVNGGHMWASPEDTHSVWWAEVWWPRPGIK